MCLNFLYILEFKEADWFLTTSINFTFIKLTYIGNHCEIPGIFLGLVCLSLGSQGHRL